MQTLLVIDMQNAWLDEAPRHDIQGVLARIEQVAERFRATGKRLIFIRHQDAQVIPNSLPWQVTSELSSEVNDLFVEKTACDSFWNTSLLQTLHEIGTHELVVCGLATEFCVDTTLRAALSHGFHVTVLSDAHTTANRPHLDSASIIAHHNWVWTHIATPCDVTISVIKTEDFLTSTAQA